MTSRGVWRMLPPIGAALALAWLAGFFWFIYSAEQPATSQATADGIVVLTGGADRIATGLRLLKEGRGHALLISGVGKGGGLGVFAREAGIDPATLAGRVTLGREATSTTGNADETAAWVREKDVHSLLVVTASYHMPRAMTELGRTVPGVRLIAAPVLPPALRDGGRLRTLRLLANEYTKWLAAELGLTRLANDPVREPG